MWVKTFQMVPNHSKLKLYIAMEDFYIAYTEFICVIIKRFLANNFVTVIFPLEEVHVLVVAFEHYSLI